MQLTSRGRSGWSAAVILLSFWLACLAAAESLPPGKIGKPMDVAAAEAFAPLQQAEALRNAGQFAEALAQAEAALADARSRKDLEAEASVQALRAGLLERLREGEKAAEAWREAELLYGRTSNGPGRIRAILHQAFLLQEPAAIAGHIQRAVDLSERETRNPAEVAARLTDGGIAFDRRGDNGTALRLFEASLRLRRWLDPHSAAIAEHLELLGNLSLRLGREEAGELFHREALFHRERADRDSPAVGSSLSNLAFLELARGHLPQARSLAERCVAVYESGDPNPGKHAAALRLLAKVQLTQREPEAARTCLVRAMAILEADPQRNPDLLAECLNLLCEAHMALSQPILAREQGQRLVEVVTAARPGSAQEARARRQFAGILARLGRESEARQEYGRMVALLEQVEADPLEVSMSYLDLATLDLRTHNRDEARIYLERAAALAGKVAPNSGEYGRILGALGLWAFGENDFHQAGEWFRQAFEVFRRSRPGSREQLMSLIHQGWTFERMSRLDEAESVFREAEGLVEQMPDQPGMRLMVEEALGILASHRGDLAQAEQRARTVLTLLERYEPSQTRSSTALANLGGVLLRQRKTSEAERLLARAWELKRQEFAESSNPELLSRLAADHQWIVAALIEARVHLGRTLEAFTTREQARGRALETLLFDRRYADATVPRALRERLAQATAVQEAAEAELAARSHAVARAEAEARRPSPEFIPNGDAPIGGVKEARERFNRARDAQILARQEVERLWEQIVSGTGPSRQRTVDVDAVRASLTRLQAGEVFIAFQALQDGVLVFVAQGPAVRKVTGATPTSPAPVAEAVKIDTYRIVRKEGEIAEQISRLGERIAAGSGEAVLLGRELSDLLFPPSVRAKILTCKRLILSPDGPLWDLPFAALPFTTATGTPSYLGLLKPISLTPSLVLRERADRRKRQPLPVGPPVVLAVGDPVFDRTGQRLAVNQRRAVERAFLFADGKAPAPLPGTREDAWAVARLYGAKPLLGEDATEKAVREQMPKADVIHLATHGYLNPQWAMASGVLLTEPAPGVGARDRQPVEDPRNDGALQAWEILSQLKLRAELVVLAACETGKGQLQRGEGLLGLTRALHVAGARSVVASQWKVRDDSTRELMAQFHQGIREGLAKDEALRRGMARVQKRNGWAHPYYWAGFVLTGAVDNPSLGRPAIQAE